MSTRMRLVRLFSSSLASQVLLSATNFAVGLLLIRHVSDRDYGFYVLGSNAVLLATSLQGAFLGGPLVSRMSALDDAAQQRMAGGLWLDQQRLLLWTCGALGLAALALAGRIGTTSLALLAVFAVAALMAMYREYFRMLMLFRRLAPAVLAADALYAATLLAGIVAALLLPATALVAGAALASAGLLGGALMHRQLRQATGWRLDQGRGALRQLAPLGVWAGAGAAIYWTYSQGYAFLMAGTLEVATVAAVAAVRLTLMPVNLLSIGVRQLLLPMSADWLRLQGPDVLLRRLIASAVLLLAMAAVYMGLLWLVRDWLFAEVLAKPIPQRDALLLLWCGIVALSLVRDQIYYLLVLRERFRILTGLSLACAALSLLLGYAGMLRFGAPGALIGMIAGEVLNLAGVLALVWREMPRARAAFLAMERTAA